MGIRNLLRSAPIRGRRPILLATGVTAVAAAVLGGLVVALREPGRAPAAGPSTAPVVAASDPRAIAIRRDYRAYWDALLRASDPADPNNAELLRHVTGDELDRVRTALTARRQSGEIVRGS